MPAKRVSMAFNVPSFAVLRPSRSCSPAVATSALPQTRGWKPHPQKSCPSCKSCVRKLSVSRCLRGNYFMHDGGDAVATSAKREITGIKRFSTVFFVTLCALCGSHFSMAPQGTFNGFQCPILCVLRGLGARLFPTDTRLEAASPKKTKQAAEWTPPPVGALAAG